MDIDQALGVEALRARLLEHSLEAYHLLPVAPRPLSLDIGCGRGQQTVEVARLSGGRVVGIDIDGGALAKLRARIVREGLGEQIEAIQVSLFDNDFATGCFDLLWEEGVLHLLDASRAFAECSRLLRPEGFLVMHETVTWFQRERAQLEAAGFDFFGEHLLPVDFWWTDYGAPLEERIRAYREGHTGEPDPPGLAEHVAAVASIKRDPEATACGIFLLRRLTKRRK